MQTTIAWVCIRMYGPCLKQIVYELLVQLNYSTLQVVVPLVRMEGCVVVSTSITVTVPAGTQDPTARPEVSTTGDIHENSA